MINRQTVTTAEAAFLFGEDARSFARWARKHGINPVRRQRIGRSTVTVWDLQQLTTASASQLDAHQDCVVN